MVVLSPSLTDEYFNWLIGWTAPSVAQSTLIFFESFRTLPGEVRMYGRILHRGRINIVELLFILIKYLSLLATITAPIQDWTNWLNVTGCVALSWVQQMGMMLCTTLVTSTLAWRCYIIFQRSRRVGLICLAVLAVHLFLAIFTCCAQAKYDITREGFCAHSPEVMRANHDKKWYELRGSWFVLASAIIDSSFVGAASWRLLRFVQGPTGLQRIGRLLFLNNVHYLVIISTLNLAYFWVLCFLNSKVPPLLWLTITIQIIVSLQMLISEQDEAHGHGNRPTYHTAWRGGATGNAGGASFGGFRGSSFAPLKSGTQSKSHATSMTTTLTQQQTITPYTQPLEGIRFDELHESIVVDTSATSQTQLQEHLPPHLPHDYPTRPPLAGPASARVAPWDYQEADGSVSAYVNDEVPVYSASPHSPRDPFKTSSLRVSSDNLTVFPNANSGLSIRAIRSNLAAKKSKQDEIPHEEDDYAMAPLSSSRSMDPLSPRHANNPSLTSYNTIVTADGYGSSEPLHERKRTDSMGSGHSTCTCGRTSISYGTALTRELNNDQVTNHPSGIANDSRGHESEPPGAPSVHFSHAQSQHDHQIEEMESHGNEEYAVPYSPSRHHRR